MINNFVECIPINALFKKMKNQLLEYVDKEVLKICPVNNGFNADYDQTTERGRHHFQYSINQQAVVTGGN